MAGYSPLLPLEIDPDDGISLTKTYKQVASQNLKMLVMTNPGEKVMSPEFGVGIKRYLFETPSPTLSSAIKTKINEQVNKYLSYIQINDIIVGDTITTPDNIDNNLLSVKINYFIKPLDLHDTLEVLIDFGATIKG